MIEAKDITGRKFGNWTVMRRVANRGRNPMWLCRCACGVERPVQAGALKFGSSKSCHSCKGFDAKKSEYWSWRSMLNRCLKATDPAYPRYGGRGITVCARWRKSFYAFYADMGQRPAGMELDRTDNNKGYSPANCRWATPVENCNNRRSNRLITFQGKTKTLMQWSNETGIKRTTIQMRLDRYGYSIEEALTA